MSAYIISAGLALPEKVVTNRELAPLLGVSRDWIEMNSGIRERRWVSESESSSTLASQAARRALENAGRSAGDVDYLIASTLSPDFQIPGIAPLVQQRLATKAIPAVDLRVACSSILYSLQIARALLGSGAAGNVLCCAAEAQSKGLILDRQNAEISMLFGDGAGALMASAAPRAEACNLRIDDVLIETDGGFALDLCLRSPGTANGKCWIDREQTDAALAGPSMSGRTVILQAVRKLSEAAAKLLARNGLQPEDVGFIIPHQANLNLLSAVAKKLSVPIDRVVVNLDRYGNTSSASAFIALAEAWQQGGFAEGSKILFLAFGAGFTWGAALCTCI